MLRAEFPLSRFLPLHQPLWAAQVSGRGGKIKCCHSFLPQRQKAEAILDSSATTGKRKGKGALGSATQESSSSLTATKGLGNTKVEHATQKELMTCVPTYLLLQPAWLCRLWQGQGWLLAAHSLPICCSKPSPTSSTARKSTKCLNNLLTD